MKLSDKILQLRKAHGWSQEDLAEKLGVSRQAVSRWERATAQPDAANILQLSILFGVTTDYLLHDEYESDNDLPKVRAVGGFEYAYRKRPDAANETATTNQKQRFSINSKTCGPSFHTFSFYSFVITGFPSASIRGVILLPYPECHPK